MGVRGDSKEFSKFRFESNLEKNGQKSNKEKIIAKLKVGYESI